MITNRRARRSAAWLILAALMAAACTGDDESSSTTEQTVTTDGAGTSTSDDDSRGTNTVVAGDPVDSSGSVVGFRLSDGVPTQRAPEQDAVEIGTPLSDAEVEALLDRLPEWDVPPVDVAEFNRPADSLAPPVVGDTAAAPFPPASDAPDQPDAQAVGPLEVLRFQPEGAVDIAPFIAVTFNEPMVELSTLEQLDAVEVPITITPVLAESAGIDGRWRWIGTRTARFEVTPDGDATTPGAGNDGLDRLPASTDYTVTVPAGTESANGAVLDDEVSFEFSTPPVSVEELWGLDESTRLDPVFVASFDQRVDATAIVESIALDAGDVDGVRLATEAELSADAAALAFFDGALDERAVAFVPSATLDADTAIDLRIGPDLPSLEGPRTSSEPFTATGRTYPPLEVVRSECFDPCSPFSSFEIELSNPLDRETFDPTWIDVEPAIPGLRVENFDNLLFVSGATAGNTTYQVVLAPELVDAFGQTLGDAVELEFRVGDPRPVFVGPDRQFVTTDPFADTPSVAYTSVGHERLAVTAWQVAPDQFGEFRDFLETTFSDTRPDDPDWPTVLDTTVDIDGAADRLTETVVDLTAAFGESGGPLVLRVEPDPMVDPADDEYFTNRPSYVWVQQADIAADVFVAHDELLVWVTDLLSGEPIDEASVVPTGSEPVVTDAGGVVRIPLDQPIDGLVATDGDRSVMVPSINFNGWESFERFDETRWYVIDDRGTYRPGETVRMTGLIRSLTADDAQLAFLDGSPVVRYTAFDAQGSELAAGDAAINALGGFNIAIDLPAGANTGPAFVDLALADSAESIDVRSGFGHEFQIQEFRTPEFQVAVRAETPAPYFLVDGATVAVDADYFAGGPLGGADTEWLVSATTTSYDPPDWDEFSFGVWTPWWFGESFVDEDFAIEPCFDCGPGFEDPRFQQYSGRTDASGTHLLQIDFDDIPASADPEADPEPVDQPTALTAEATVFDVNRQAISSRTDLIVHPAQYYVGLRSERGFIERGDPIVIDTTVVDIDGTPVSGRDVTVTAGRLEPTFRSGRFVEETVDQQTCTITSTDAVTNEQIDESMRCSFPTEVGGQYEITATVVDDDGRTNRAVYSQWVSGADATPARGLEQGEVTIVPDVEFHAPGDTAELLVQAPFSPASGLATVTRAGIESVQTFDAPEGSAVVEIPIADDDIAAVSVRIDMVGADERVADDGTPLPDAPLQPAFASGVIELQIPPTTRTLGVEAMPATERVEPGDSTSVSVQVTDPDGSPVADAGVALIVVDEAVLSLSGYELADPLEAMYQPVFGQLDPQLLRNSIILANPDVFGDDGGGRNQSGAGDDTVESEAMDADAAMDEATSDGDFEVAATAAVPESAAAEGNAPATPIDVRDDFDALAVFAPDERTGADGIVEVDIDLPDGLTRYRVMAVAVDGVDRFGSDESAITARLPVSVRPSAPRFLNFGDRFELPVVVQNQTAAAIDVDVALEAANLELPEGAGRRVTVPANDRVEVRFPAAAVDVGTARFRVASVAGEYTDAAEVDLPVYTPATAEAFATYGVVDDAEPIVQPLAAPEGVIPQFGGLEISTSSTALQALTDSVLYLHDYPYDSADGYASRIMAVAALRDVLDAFEAAGLPDPSELDSQVASDIVALQALQNDDGGFPSWQRGRPSIPWVSVQSAHSLVLAEQNGYDVDPTALDAALNHLRSIEGFIPADYSAEARDAIAAYALYVRNVAGDGDPDKALDLYRSGVDDTLQLDAIAQLWTVIDDAGVRDEIERSIGDAAVETAGAASFVTSYGEGAYVIAYSDRRTDGIILGALVNETPDSDLIPKVVAGLLGDQVQGRWNNAQENSFILLALNAYFDTFESVDPDFVARAWLGETYAAESEFRGRSVDTSLTTVPMGDVITAGDTDLILAKEGDGRLYYRLGLRYSPDDFDLDPRDEGFVVERTYEAVDADDDVRRNDDGTWDIAAGATVRVRLTMVADAQRTHVALIDPMPAGFEPVNPALATSLTVPADDPSVDYSGSWFRQWFEHQNLRDDRAEAFTSFLPGGTYEYTYLARATTPGEFVVPPTRAEEIFSPEVFGRGSSETVVVSTR